jgi:hypothetical protein
MTEGGWLEGKKLTHTTLIHIGRKWTEGFGRSRDLNGRHAWVKALEMNSLAINRIFRGVSSTFLPISDAFLYDRTSPLCKASSPFKFNGACNVEFRSPYII